MNLQHLEYLIEIENCGSISKAARRLFVTQPYLSRILKEVESEYGITVFTREKTGITPTDSGRLFLDMARDLLDDARQLSKDLPGTGRPLPSESLGLYLLPPQRRVYPHGEIHSGHTAPVLIQRKLPPHRHRRCLFQPG